jgi:hypothetical protein
VPANFVLLERIELNASAASVTFANIPQTGYTDLKVVISARSTRSDYTFGSVSIVFNSTTSGYSYNWLKGDGSNPNTGTGSSIAYLLNLYAAPSSTATANTFGNSEFYIPNYTSSNFKSVSIDTVAENNATLAQATLTAGLWSNTAAINSITLSETNGNAFTANSTFSLYGLAALGTTPAIAPKASGGNVIATDGTYWYHAFLTGGTFTPQVGLTCDALVVAGGGGGGANWGGGGGAGGVLAFTSQSFAPGSYSATVGGGGAAGTGSANGTAGTNSTLGSLTTCVGGGYGAGAGNVGGNGGSGGGGAAAGTTAKAGGTPTSGQGFAGGTSNPNPGAGGGGSGAVGGDSSAGACGTGGAGLNTWSTWLSATGLGVSGFIAGGGGGGGVSNAGAGGSGGGGAGSITGTGTNGTVNTGSGAGGGAISNGSFGAGGSGIIIIRYPIV